MHGGLTSKGRARESRDANPRLASSPAPGSAGAEPEDWRAAEEAWTAAARLGADDGAAAGQWEGAGAGAEAEVVLPEGWSTEYDPDSGYPYYYNHLTNESSWELPEGSV